MKWNTIEQLPTKKGFYLCYFPESEIYKEHFSERWFDGEFFRDGDTLKFWTDTRMYGRKINKHISHWMKVEKPS